MRNLTRAIDPSRRQFFLRTAGGMGAAALATLIGRQNALADESPPLGAPHDVPRATSCIFVYLYGGFSHLDLFDPKPKLNELQGQPLPESLIANVRFAFVKKETATIMGSPRTFQPHGGCGMEISDLLPNLAGSADDLALIRSMHTEAFNHAPGEMMANTGTQAAGHPSVGAWLTYGLGSECENLPAFVVLVASERDKAYNWGNGFLPPIHQGVRFRSQGTPLLNLENPPGVSPQTARSQLDALGDLNRLRLAQSGDDEIAARIAAYELAFRMQTAAPELVDLSRETAATRAAYGVDRADETARTFSTHCLLARRLVERGVRFVHLIQGNWDHHKDLERDLPTSAATVDQPLAALIRDLKQRGLLGSTLVVITTEFGRTPVSDNGQNPTMPNGRDHHPFAFSTALAGGGTRAGYVLGRTDELGWGVVEDPVHTHDLHATLLHLFGLDHTRLTYRFKGREFRLTDVAGNVVSKLLA